MEVTDTGPIPLDFSLHRYDEVPAWHNPFKCDAFRPWAADETEPTDTRLRAFAVWQTQNATSVRECQYHQLPLVRAMEIAVEFIKGHLGKSTWGSGADGLSTCAEVARAYMSGLPDEQLVHHAYYFITEPIIWGGGSYLKNGQHRMCVLRWHKVEEIVVCSS